MVEVTAKGMHCFAYHHVNGFDVDEEGEKIVFDTCTWDVFNLYFKDIVEPDGTNHFPRTKFSRFELDTKTGIATHRVLDQTPCEYPTVAPQATGVPYRCTSCLLNEMRIVCFRALLLSCSSQRKLRLLKTCMVENEVLRVVWRIRDDALRLGITTVDWADWTRRRFRASC
jgi:hypothetical protein